ncbi:YbaB/EbfC family nucleoid-associated protein [Pseudomonas sp. NIBR-H-19]|uniref:YbaB/EbfC family nucleoid-associated protein n=1 Tax=Pseudomonas sp. NIBR-H-19 TaxID=2901380 RepID=UPI001E63F0C7|nr:YbaB/EbfC family nucleoid-associated protein [Pseudomonas sp. NIBR-H-19]UHC81697.1 YbaB/EbfC family nucleoid-associated protein [Pseudomonas sp. NIBR-H-19]
MQTTTFRASSVSVEGVARNGDVTITVTGDPRQIVEDMDIDDRLYDLEERDIIDQVGSSELLVAMTEEELATWLRSESTDPSDMLNAIGEEAVLEWLNSCDSDSNSPV